MKQSVILALLLFVAGCDGCNSDLVPVGDAYSDSASGNDGAGSDVGYELVDGEVADLPDFDIFGVPETADRADFVTEPDPHEVYSDLYPPDPWIPDYWDVPFDYMDLAGDSGADPELCGNGEMNPGEECDDGNTNDNDECNNRCMLPRCGDGSVWFEMEDCDPPGTTRPCMTSCDSVGVEWCEVFCRWEGDCIPPLEVCGNGVDDDCDGIVDAIVRLTPPIPVTDSMVGRNALKKRLAWTSSEFVVLWGDSEDRTVLTRLDARGAKLDWDRPLDFFFGTTYNGIRDLSWTGSLLGYFSIIPQAGQILTFRSIHADGSPAAEPLLVASEAMFFADNQTAWSGREFGIAFDRAEQNRISFISVTSDGESASGEVTLDFGTELAFPYCMGAADPGFVLAARISNDWEYGWRSVLAFLNPDGEILDVVDIDQPLENFECILSDDYLISLYAHNDSSSDVTFILSLHAMDGSLAGSDEIVSGVDFHTEIDYWDTEYDRPSVVWTGSETGAFWRDRRSGNEEIYFIRTDASASPLMEPLRLTQSSEPSGFPTAVWDGGAYAVTWRDSDGINDDIYFTRFTACP